MNRGTLTVTHTAYRGKLRDYGKTRKALRTVHLPEGLVNELWLWKQECPDHSPEAFVFPSARKRIGAKKNGFMTDNYRARVLAAIQYRGKIIAITQVAGLHHRYERCVA